MGKVIYGMNVSIDGYIEDSSGSIAFSGPPADDVHRHWNEHTRAAAASLYGRRLFEVMDEHWTAAAMQTTYPTSRRNSHVPMSTRRVSCSPIRWRASHPVSSWFAAGARQRWSAV